MQVAGDVETVSADAKISFPINAITPQLASGKVLIPPKDFYAALPEQYRGLFLPEAVEAPVQLSLPDVLANLPGDSLRMRDDQEVFSPDEIFETPFLAKAKEDAATEAKAKKEAKAAEDKAKKEAKATEAKNKREAKSSKDKAAADDSKTKNDGKSSKDVTKDTKSKDEKEMKDDKAKK